MRHLSVLKKYSYSLTAMIVTMGMALSLVFALVSALRHLIWLQMMKEHPMIPGWLWVSVVVLTMMIVVFWYRVMMAIMKYSRQRKLLTNSIALQLLPFPRIIQDDLLKMADWYLLDDETHQYAFTWGITHARIGISTGLWNVLDDASRKAVMYHEVAHVVARDSFQQTVLQVLSSALHPFGLKALYRRYLLRREIEADQLAISACGGDDVPLLTAILIATRSMPSQGERVGLAGSLDARIQFLETSQYPSWWDRTIRYRLLATLLAVSLTIGEGLLVWCH